MPHERPVGSNDKKRNNVEANRSFVDVVIVQIMGGKHLVTAALFRIDSLFGQTGIDARSRLYLYEHECAAIVGDDVDLAGTATPIALKDLVAPPFKKARCSALAPSAELLVIA